MGRQQVFATPINQDGTWNSAIIALQPDASTTSHITHLAAPTFSSRSSTNERSSMTEAATPLDEDRVFGAAGPNVSKTLNSDNLIQETLDISFR